MAAVPVVRSVWVVSADRAVSSREVRRVALRTSVACVNKDGVIMDRALVMSVRSAVTCVPIVGCVAIDMLARGVRSVEWFAKLSCVMLGITVVAAPYCCVAPLSTICSAENTVPVTKLR